MDRQWLGRKGHRSLPCREKGTSHGWSKLLGWGKGMLPTSDSVTTVRVLRYPAESGWYGRYSTMTRRVTALSHIRAALDRIIGSNQV